jgi:hypothetical protein
MDIKEILAAINGDFFLLNDPDATDPRFATLEPVEPIVWKNKWIGFPPASNTKIALTETKLDVSLPPSYKSFLNESNGFRHICPFLEHLLPIEQVDWIIDTDREWVALMQGLGDGCAPVEDEEYFVYGPEQDELMYRPRHFRKSLKISTMYDSCVVMLNPEVKFGEEWEVIWISYASTFWGRRYQSFHDFLTDIHKTNQDILTNPH